MDWEEKFKAFKEGTLEQSYTEKYGPIVGPWLLEYENKDTDGQASWRAQTRYTMLQEYFKKIEEDVPQWIQEDFIKGLNFNKDYIQENLQSHNWKGMMSVIEKKYPAREESEAIPDHGPLSRVLYYPQVQYEDIPKWKQGGEALADVKKIADFFGYTITKIKRGLAEDPYFISFEPNKAASATDELQKCGNIGYSIVPVPNSDSVEKNGLRCKNGNSAEIRAFDKHFNMPKGTTKPYKKFPERIYFCVFPEEWGRPPLEGLEDVCSELGRDWNQVDVYEINFKGLNIEIYKDPAMNSNHAFYTYTNIPASRLKKVHSGEDRRSFEDYW